MWYKKFHVHMLTSLKIIQVFLKWSKKSKLEMSFPNGSHHRKKKFWKLVFHGRLYQQIFLSTIRESYPKTINFCDINSCDINFCELCQNSQKLMSQNRFKIGHSQKLMSQKIFKSKKVRHVSSTLDMFQALWSIKLYCHLLYSQGKYTMMNGECVIVILHKSDIIIIPSHLQKLMSQNLSELDNRKN